MTPLHRSPVRTALALAPVLVLAACGHNARYGGVPYNGYDPNAHHHYAPTRYYPPPGPPSDPWGPYIREASGRFKIPDQWIRAVMRQESGGREQAISSAGAMGLMQVMPATYDMLRREHNLGADPYDPHNNILAGSAYIREMYDRFGAPGFLAAYNAGPERLDNYLAGSADLPRETVNYVASITPNLGSDVALSGPLAVYGSNSVASYARPAPTIASLASGCNLDAAYDPDHPCQPLERQAIQPAPIQPAPIQPAPLQPAPQVQTASLGCDFDAAYNPRHPCQAPRRAAPTIAFAPPPEPPPPKRMAAAPPPASGTWGIQVGAFANLGLAHAVAEGARTEAVAQLRTAALSFPPTTPFGGQILYRARLVNLSANAADLACQHLNQRQLPCVVVPPTGS
jgi:hypothetical protein